MKILLPYQFPKKDSVFKGYNQWFLLLLIVYTVLGFIFELDNNQKSDCVLIENESMFTYKNVGYSSFSIILFCAAFVTRQRQVQILLFELLFWVYKLFYLKGGYAIGLAAQPILGVVLFDTIGLSLRILFLSQISQVPIKNRYLAFSVLIIMMLKMGYFRYLLFQPGV